MDRSSGFFVHGDATRCPPSRHYLERLGGELCRLREPAKCHCQSEEGPCASSGDVRGGLIVMVLVSLEISGRIMAASVSCGKNKKG